MIRHCDATSLERGDGSLPYLEAFLEMRIARQDEVSDAGLSERIDGRGNLIMGADERRARSATEKADAGPESRRELERPGVPAGDESRTTAVDLRHPALPDRL